jgi:hypothetical protein
MSFLPEITTKTVTLAGGLLATGAAVVAQASSTDTSVGTGSFLLGGAGLVAAISAFTKEYWTDRQKQREHEVNVLRMKLRVCRSHAAVTAIYNWLRAAHAAVPTLPPVPELHLDDDTERDKGQRDA